MFFSLSCSETMLLLSHFDVITRIMKWKFRFWQLWVDYNSQDTLSLTDTILAFLSTTVSKVCQTSPLSLPESQWNLENSLNIRNIFKENNFKYDVPLQTNTHAPASSQVLPSHLPAVVRGRQRQLPPFSRAKHLISVVFHCHTPAWP